MKKGWISLHRTIMDHWLWNDGQFSKAQAWIDLLMMANHASTAFPVGNEIVLVERGQLITSEEKLMKRWGWSKTKVRAFLDILQKDQMLIRKSDRRKTTLTICQYDTFQESQTTKKPQKDLRKTTKDKQTIKTNKENNEEEESCCILFNYVFRKAYLDSYGIEYNTKQAETDNSVSLLNKIKSFIDSTNSKSYYPWEYTLRYLNKIFETANGFHRQRISIEHVDKYFNELHMLVIDDQGKPLFSIPHSIHNVNNNKHFMDHELQEKYPELFPKETPDTHNTAPSGQVSGATGE